MRILFASTSGEGHIGPLVELMQASRDLGHATMIVSSRSALASLKRTGLDFTLGDDPSPDDARRVWSRFASLTRPDAAAMVEREWFATLCTNALMTTVHATVTTWKPDLVLRETSEYSSAIVCDRLNVPQAQVGISTATAEASVLTSLVAPDLDASEPDVASRILSTPYLTRFPASMDESPYPATLRYHAVAPAASATLPNWWTSTAFPLVYLTLGTVASAAIRLELLRLALEYLRDLNVRVLVTTGDNVMPHELGPLPENAHAEQWVDQRDIVAVASLVICHGGSGTTYGALGAGVPLVMLPMFADQPTNARLVVEAGAGLSLADGSASADSNVASYRERMSSLAGAVHEVLTTPRYRAAAQRVADEMHATDSPHEVMARLVREYVP